MANLSDLEEGFDEALDSAEEAKGYREKVHFRGQDIDAIVHEQVVAPDYVASGLSKNEPWQVDIRKREVNLPINHVEPITVRGISLFVLSHKPLSGRVSIIAGDPSEEVR